MVCIVETTDNSETTYFSCNVMVVSFPKAFHGNSATSRFKCNDSTD